MWHEGARDAADRWAASGLGARLAPGYAASVDLARLSSRQRWVYALKLASWPKLLVPCALGQAVGFATTGRLSLPGLLFGLGFTVLDLSFIVLLNDWGDQQVDRLKREMFPHGCSPKTIPDGILSSRAVLLAGLCAGGAALSVALLAQIWFHTEPVGRPWAALLGASCLGLFAAYTLPPLKLNYRGGGELLEGLGVGLLLPYFNFYLQSGQLGATAFLAQLGAPSLALLGGFFWLSLASAVASGLSDEESDRKGGKRTLASLAGNRVARYTAETCMALGALAWLLVPLSGYLRGGAFWRPAGPSLSGALGALVVVAFWVPLRRASHRARTGCFAEQAAYKGYLHRGIWYGALAVCLACAATG